MSSLQDVRRSLLVWIALGFVLGTIEGRGVANATDFNIDYPGTVANCPGNFTFGGAALKFTGIAMPGSAGYLYYIDQSILYDRYAAADCSGNTWVTWACDEPPKTRCDVAGFTGFTATKAVHLGVTVDDAGATMDQGYVYNNKLTWPETTNVTDALGSSPCSAANTCNVNKMAALRVDVAIGPGDYSCLGISPFGVAVHTDGKTLVVVSGSLADPPCPCKESVFLGNVRFEYYVQRQPLSTLNRFGGREPFEVDSVPGGPVGCGDTIVVVNSSVPANAHFVVVTGTIDSVATVDSPRGTRFWVQEVIVHEGEHLITASAGPHGTIDPRGSVVIANGGNQSFTITPDAGYQVNDVVVDGISVGPVTTYTLSAVTVDHSILASFEPINTTPDCGHVTALPAQLWPPNHRLVPVRISGITDPNGDPVTTRVTRITQDEPQGSGNHGPDAVINSDGTCLLRAERAGNGNGRVYTIWFTADDGRGGLCDGSAQVCVPHDRDHPECIDDGRTINALVSSDEAGTAAAATTSKLELIGTAMVGRMATVEYSLPTAGRVHLSVYDVAGRRVAVVENQSLGEGTHKATWDTSGLAHGVYFYRLQLGPATVSKSLMILR